MMKASSIVTRNILQQKRVLNLSRRNLCAQIIPATIEETEIKLTRSQTAALLAAALKPREVVAQLDKFIVGQMDAKKAVAIALRNRWRRHQMSDDIKSEVIPKNILMIGPTGCGKTEIARRIAKLSQAPFIKVEATKFTEVGFHGKDVDSIIKDLLDIAITMTTKRIKDERKAEITILVQDQLIDAMCGVSDDMNMRTSMHALLLAGDLEGREVTVDVPVKEKATGGGDKGLEAITAIISAGKLSGTPKFGKNGKRYEKKKMTVAEARPIMEENESDKLIDEYDIPKEAIASVEESGIVFIDEIDKLCSGGMQKSSSDASSEGVQRDLLPLIEGSCITTKYGNVNTDFILFIASGAFHSSKPSDLLAELQGRLPIRVALKGLTQDDLYSILTEPVTNLIRQQVEMLKSESVALTFSDTAIREIARVAFETNRTVENIGARRLHTVIERIVEEISFDAPDKAGTNFEIDEAYVKRKVGDLLEKGDMRKYIL